MWDLKEKKSDLQERSGKESSLWRSSFKEAVCRALPCPPEQYEARVFWRCLYPHAYPFAFIIHHFRPEYFEDDYDLIRQVADVRHPGVFSTEMNFFHGRSIRHRSWWRRKFMLRVSGQRMIDLKNRIFR